jgi:uncharacterized protein YggT (Ycf19 family)
MQTIMKITSSVITAYMLLIFLRVLLTWFRGPEVGRPIELLGKITDPYLNYFRRFKWLKVAEIDFSPIAAIILLIILTNFTSTIGALGTITLGITLALVIGSIWSGASWILTFFIIITIIHLLYHHYHHPVHCFTFTTEHRFSVYPYSRYDSPAGNRKDPPALLPGPVNHLPDRSGYDSGVSDNRKHPGQPYYRTGNQAPFSPPFLVRCFSWS